MNSVNRTCVIAMPALTGALRAESLLQRSGIAARTVKLPAGTTKKGCAYGVETGALYCASALQLIENARIPHGETLS